MSIQCYKTIEWEEISIEEEYNRYMENNVARIVKTTNAQQLTCKTTLNNFTVNTRPNDCIKKLMFLIKQQLKLAKQKDKITLVEELQQIFKPEYRLNTSSLKLWADDHISLFTNTIETNPNNLNKNPIQQNNWQCLDVDIFCQAPTTKALNNPNENPIQQNNWRRLASTRPCTDIDISRQVPVTKVPNNPASTT